MKNFLLIASILLLSLIIEQSHASTFVTYKNGNDNFIAFRKNETTLSILNNMKVQNESLLGHTQLITGLITLTNGDFLSASRDGLIKSWNWKKGTLSKFVNISNGIDSLLIFKNRRVALGLSNKTIVLMGSSKTNIEKWMNATNLTSFDEKTNNARMNLAVIDDNHLASAAGDGLINVWTDLNNNETVKYTFNVPLGEQLLFTLPNNDLVSGDSGSIGSNDSVAVRVWDMKSGISKFNFTQAEGGHVKPVTAFAAFILDKESWLASGSADGSIRVWNYLNGSLIFSYNSTDGARGVKSLVFLNDGQLAAGFGNGEVKVFNVTNKLVSAKPFNFENPIDEMISNKLGIVLTHAGKEVKELNVTLIEMEPVKEITNEEKVQPADGNKVVSSTGKTSTTSAAVSSYNSMSFLAILVAFVLALF